MRAPALLVLMILSAGCAPSKYQIQMQQFEQQKIACVTSQPPAVEKLDQDAIVGMEERSGCVPVERGEVGGLAYMIDHSSGRAEFYESESKPAWVVMCRKDAVTDEVIARVIKGSLTVFRMASLESVGVAEQVYPGSPQTVRIDGNDALVVSSGDTPILSNGKKAIEQMMTGNKIIVRHVDWPYGINRDAEYGAIGFDVAYRYSQRCVP